MEMHTVLPFSDSFRYSIGGYAARDGNDFGVIVTDALRVNDTVYIYSLLSVCDWRGSATHACSCCSNGIVARLLDDEHFVEMGDLEHFHDVFVDAEQCYQLTFGGTGLAKAQKNSQT